MLAGLLLLGIALLLASRGVRIPRTLLPAWQPATQLLKDAAARKHLLWLRLQFHQGGGDNQAVQFQQLRLLGWI